MGLGPMEADALLRRVKETVKHMFAAASKGTPPAGGPEMGGGKKAAGGRAGSLPTVARVAPATAVGAAQATPAHGEAKAKADDSAGG